MIIKEDINEAKERMKAWWDHETTDRPVISYNIPEGPGSEKALVASSALNFDLGKDWDGIEPILDKIENFGQEVVWGGESIPRYFPNYGPGVMAAVLGIFPEYKEGTIWFHRKTDLKEIVSVLEDAKLNDNNEWYKRLKRTTRIAAERGAKYGYIVAMTDLGGILDILVSFLGPTNVIVQMKRNPELIDTCRAIIMEKYLKVYDELQNIINSAGCDGMDTWLNVWCPKRYYTMQCDLSVMLNPKFFKRFVEPDLKEQSEHMDYAIYHLDGPEQIKFLDDILPYVDGIQFVPGMKAGMSQDGADKWIPLYKKIQDAGKNNVLAILEPKEIAPFYRKMNSTKGLFVYSVFLRKMIADCYLPEFIGGNGGKIVDAGTIWAIKNKVDKISRVKIREFLEAENIQVDKNFEGLIFKEIKSKIAKKQTGLRLKSQKFLQ